MMIRNRSLIFSSAVLLGALALFSGCKKDREPNKILLNFPVNVTEIVIPGQIARLDAILKRDALSPLVKVLNALELDNPNFNALTGPDGANRYTYESPRNPFHDLVIFTIQFKDGTGAVIDPISVRTSSTSLKSVDITSSGGTGDTTFSLNLQLLLEVEGDSLSTKRVVGNSSLAGNGYNLTFLMSSNGVTTNEEGLTSGDVTATGTGPTSNVTISLSYSTNHNLDGSITWEGQTGQIHIDNDGTGFVISDNTFIPIQ